MPQEINHETPINDNITWDQYFMTIAYAVSMKSKDPSTRVGAIIVGIDNEIRSTGYNGFPRNISDKLNRYENKEYKQLIENHAEENAIMNCVRIGTPVKGCRLYTTWTPCANCARLIIQAGITAVIYDINYPGHQNRGLWQKSMQISSEMLEEAGVKLVAFKDKLLKIEGLFATNPFIPYTGDDV